MNYQEKFNEVLRNNVPDHVSLANELVDLLGVSIDSAYRRLRNQTEYSISEALSIAKHLDIPLETLNPDMDAMATFKVNHMDNNIESYKHYLENMLAQLDRLSKFQDATMVYAAEDIPVFYHFSMPTLRRFKIIYWLKSLLNIKEFQFESYETIQIDSDIIEIAEKIYKKFQQIDTTEIWTSDTVMSTLKQIRFYWDAGFIEDKNSAFVILNELEEVINRIKKNAETGFKFSNGSMTNIKQGFYHSDVMIGNNSILIKAENFVASFISYSTFNFMRTTNTHFNEQNEFWLNTLLSKSTLLSGVAEKQRNQLFKYMIKQIKTLQDYISEND